MAQFTKKAIAEAFIELLNKMPFDKISIVDIVGSCGINRNTFYYYYPDIYALIDELFETETAKIIEENRIFDSWQEGFIEATGFVYENKHALYNLYNSVNRERLEQYLYDVTLKNMTVFMKGQCEGLAYIRDGDINTLAVFYTVALMGLVMRWLGDDMKEDPVLYINDIGSMLDGNIRSSLERRNAENKKNGLLPIE